MMKYKYYIKHFFCSVLVLRLMLCCGQVPWQINNDILRDSLYRDTSMLIISLSSLETIGDIEFETGDAIGAFFKLNGGLSCAGYYELSEQDTDTLLVVSTASYNSVGYFPGDTIRLRHWDNSKACIRDINSPIVFGNESMTESTPFLFFSSYTYYLSSVTAHNFLYDYNEIVFCDDDQSIQLPTINEGFKITDSNISPYYFTSSSIEVDEVDGGFIPSDIGRGDHFITLNYDYCIKNKTFNFSVIDCDTATTFIQETSSTPYFMPTDENNVFVITDTTTVSVYNLRGRLVNKFEAPYQWTGVGSNGEFLPTGLYFIFFDDKKKYELTIVR